MSAVGSINRRESNRLEPNGGGDLLMYGRVRKEATTLCETGILLYVNIHISHSTVPVPEAGTLEAHLLSNQSYQVSRLSCDNKFV